MVDARDAETARKLAGKGITFERFFATFPLCCPSRATMPRGSTLLTTGSCPTIRTHGLRTGPTCRSRCKAGYRTAWVGKYLNEYGRTPETKREIPEGWDRWSASVAASEARPGRPDGSAFHRMFGFQLNHNGRIRRCRGPA